MSKEEALALVKQYRDSCLHPVEMLTWTYLYTTLKHIPDDIFREAQAAGQKDCSQ